MDIKELLSEKIVPSMLSGLGGAAAWGWKTFSGLTKEVRALKEEVRALKEAVRELQESDDRRGQSDQAARRVQARLAGLVRALEKRVGSAETDITTNNQAFQRYAQDQVEQWTEIARTVGFLSGRIESDAPTGKPRKTLWRR